NEALPGSRVIEPYLSSPRYLHRPKETRLRHLEVLNIARSCYQAMDVVKKRFDKVEVYIPPEELASRHKQTYFLDWSLDVLYLANYSLRWYIYDLCPHHELRLAQSIALSITSVCLYKDASDHIPADMMAIRKLIFVADWYLDGREVSFEKDMQEGEYVEKEGLEGLAHAGDIKLVRGILEMEEVKKAYSTVETSFEIWRRPGQLEEKLW
ncbi:hypothetical protein DL95DRAFT_395653, partial [Leptodontidium sp. 2 PMI_412]